MPSIPRSLRKERCAEYPSAGIGMKVVLDGCLLILRKDARIEPERMVLDHAKGVQ